jgi:O-antigen/teichoic acid export membrane protein
MLLLLAGTYVVYRYGWLSTASALGLMGLSSLITGYWLTRRLSVSLHGARSGELGGEVLRRHWGYGRWAVLTSMLMWVPSNVFFLLLPIWNGLDASAALKALWNFILPILQVNSALAVLLVPMLVGARQTTSFESFVRRLIALFAVGSVAYWILLGLMHRQMIDWLYGGKYANYSDMLWLLGLVPVASGIVVVTSGALRALEKPEQVFRAYALSTIVALGVGVGLISIWGVVGAVVATLLSYTVTAIFMTFRYLRARKTFEGSESEL